MPCLPAPRLGRGMAARGCPGLAVRAGPREAAAPHTSPERPEKRASSAVLDWTPVATYLPGDHSAPQAAPVERGCRDRAAQLLEELHLSPLHLSGGDAPAAEEPQTPRPRKRVKAEKLYVNVIESILGTQPNEFNEDCYIVKWGGLQRDFAGTGNTCPRHWERFHTSPVRFLPSFRIDMPI